MADTPIRQLMLTRDAADRRNRAVDAAEKRSDLARENFGISSRTWSRQHEALNRAIVNEPPVSVDDVLAVLVQLAGMHDQMLSEGDEASVVDHHLLSEITFVAVANCALRLAATVRPEDEPTEAQHDDLTWIQKRVECWLPKSEDQ